MSGTQAVNDIPQPEPEPDVLSVPVAEPEPEPEPEPTRQPRAKTFSEEEFNAERERIRAEERSKMHTQLEKNTAELEALRKEREDREKATAKAQADAEAAAKKAAEEEMSAKQLLEQREQEWNARWAQIEADRDRDRALLETERRYSALQDYRSIRMAEFQDSILPELRDLVSGNSEEEIDNSISSLVQKTDDILGNVQAAQQAARQQQRGVPVTAPPVGPMENESAYEQVTAEDIRNMDMATYSKNRGRLLGAVSSRVQDKGLYG